MKLEQQVVSLEIAKRLKELGVYQYSLFYYAKWKGDIVPCYRNQLQLDGVRLKECISAFTVAELGDLLPEKVVFRNYQKRSDGAWRINWGDLEFGGDTEANTKAKLLIYLLETQLITL